MHSLLDPVLFAPRNTDKLYGEGKLTTTALSARAKPTGPLLSPYIWALNFHTPHHGISSARLALLDESVYRKYYQRNPTPIFNPCDINLQRPRAQARAHLPQLGISKRPRQPLQLLPRKKMAHYAPSLLHDLRCAGVRNNAHLRRRAD